MQKEAQQIKQESREGLYEVVWPLGKSAYEVVAPTQYTSDLSGKTVCELWDRLFRGDEMFSIIEDELSKRYPGVNFVNYDVFGTTHGAKDNETIDKLPELLKKHGCDVVISAVGA